MTIGLLGYGVDHFCLHHQVNKFFLNDANINVIDMI